MTWFTRLALHRRSVTILVIILVLTAGALTYQGMQREMIPDIEFPSLTVITVYPGANPGAVEREVTEPIENAAAGMTGRRDTRSTSGESLSMVELNFQFGTDMEAAQRTLQTSIGGISFPSGVRTPVVSRISADDRPVLWMSVVGDRDIPSLQRLTHDLIIPPIERTDGVFRVEVLGEVDEQVIVTVDPNTLHDLGLSMQQVADAIRANRTALPAGKIDEDGRSRFIQTFHEFGSLEDFGNLAVGFEYASPSGGAAGPGAAGLLVERPVYLRDVAEVDRSTSEATSISRTHGLPSLGLMVMKQPDANTVDVSTRVAQVLRDLEETRLPPDMELITLFDDGPYVQQQLFNLQREAVMGFFIAVAVVFLFLLNLRPTIFRGLNLTLRPTIVIGLSIPLSIFGGILLMGLTHFLVMDLSLNLMSLAGLAISVGRVVDDSIVVLENLYRHIQRGGDRVAAALEATREVGPAIITSTVTTVVIFLPLAFIPGLVGELFIPFALAASFTLIASTFVAITAVPVLGVLLLRPGDLSDDADQEPERDTWLQRLYTPVLRWSLGHKLVTLLAAGGVTLASLGLLAFIPVTTFPPAPPEYLTIELEMPTGTAISRTFPEVARVEEVLEDLRRQGLVHAYQATLGSTAGILPQLQGGAGMDNALVFVTLGEDVPQDMVEQVRDRLPSTDDATILVADLAAVADAGVEIFISGDEFSEVAAVARELEAQLSGIPEIANLQSNIARAREDVVIRTRPVAAGEFGLSSSEVARQVNRYMVGEIVGEVDLEGVTLDVVVRGPRGLVDRVGRLQDLDIQGPLGRVKLGSISDIAIEEGPASISRFQGKRSAAITGLIIAEDIQGVANRVQSEIAALELPPGVEVQVGGVFQQFYEGFEDVGLAMLLGVILVYLVMVAALGSLRDPLVIMTSLPLAVGGALVALAITGRTLSLPAMMGFLLLIGVVVANAIVLITFVEQLRERGPGVYDSLMEAGRVRLRPILMTAVTTIFALVPLALAAAGEGIIIGAELATVVIGGLISSTFLTLIVVPVVYYLAHTTVPGFLGAIVSSAGRGMRAVVRRPGCIL